MAGKSNKRNSKKQRSKKNSSSKKQRNKANNKSNTTLKKPTERKSTQQERVEVTNSQNLAKQKTSANKINKELNTNHKKKPKKNSGIKEVAFNKNMEKKFFVLILIMFIVISAFAAYTMFLDFYKVSSNLANIDIVDVENDDVEFIKSLTNSSEVVKKVDVLPQGPIIYITYTVYENTAREQVVDEINAVFEMIKENRIDLYDEYEFEVTILSIEINGEDNKDFPLGASKNIGDQLIWMDKEGKLKVPKDS